MGADNVEELEVQARQAYHAGQRSQAERLCWAILKRRRLHPEAIYLLGVLALEAVRHEEAILHLHHAVTLTPTQATYHNALGEAYRAVAAFDDAIVCYRDAIRLDPQYASAHHALGLALLDQGQTDEAIACFRQALAVNPAHARAHLNLGRALQMQKDLDGAASCFEEALRLQPAYAIAWNNLGVVRQARDRHAEAIDCFRQALRHQGDYPEAHFNLGNSQFVGGYPREAEQSFRAALRLRPNYPRALVQLGLVLEVQLRQQEAVLCFREAIRQSPADVEAFKCLGNVLNLLRDWEPALAALEEAVRLKPDNPQYFACLAYLRQQVCDWRDADATLARLWDDTRTALDEGQPAPLIPFQALLLPWGNDRLQAVAASYARHVAAQAATWTKLDARPVPPPAPRLRIGYLSGDFYDHPISHLIHRLFGLHDRGAFEVFAYSFGPNDGSRFRREIESTCEHFRDVAALPHAEIARRIADDGIHILVDLMGFTGIGRMGALAMRPAPIQVSFLGHLGTTGADFLDYVIGDPIVTPLDQASHFSERFAVLPHTYLIANPSEPPAPPPERRKLGLPENGFVFCCFNTTFKIDPRTFDLWMRILEQVSGSVLWLHSTSHVFETNIRREAARRRVDPDRLRFLTHRPFAEHRARQQAADLFLDTLLYGAAATAAMALSVSLPVLTCQGNTFAGRVSASIVTAAGAPELVCATPEEYVSRAVHLARHPDELHSLRQRLIANRESCPLFDTPRFVRNLERAYQAMWKTHLAGRPPEYLVVKE
jgi:protein O-GlcNAc transferase